MFPVCALGNARALSTPAEFPFAQAPRGFTWPDTGPLPGTGSREYVHPEMQSSREIGQDFPEILYKQSRGDQEPTCFSFIKRGPGDLARWPGYKAEFFLSVVCARETDRDHSSLKKPTGCPCRVRNCYSMVFEKCLGRLAGGLGGRHIDMCKPCGAGVVSRASRITGMSLG